MNERKEEEERKKKRKKERKRRSKKENTKKKKRKNAINKERKANNFQALIYSSQLCVRCNDHAFFTLPSLYAVQ